MEQVRRRRPGSCLAERASRRATVVGQVGLQRGVDRRWCWRYWWHSGSQHSHLKAEGKLGETEGPMWSLRPPLLLENATAMPVGGAVRTRPTTRMIHLRLRGRSPCDVAKSFPEPWCWRQAGALEVGFVAGQRKQTTRLSERKWLSSEYFLLVDFPGWVAEKRRTDEVGLHRRG